MKYLFFLMMALFIVGCLEEKSDGRKKAFMNSQKDATEEKIELEPAPILKFVEKDDTNLLFNKEEVVVKDISLQEIQDSTFKLYVEAVPGDSNVLWKKGNDPRKKEMDIQKENVRAVCLGEEGENYVFMTLRFFMDYTYPNHNVQGVLDPPKTLKSSQDKAHPNALFVDYVKMLRFMLSDVRHTGGGQIKVLKTVPFVVKNLFFLEQKSSYNIFSSYSEIDGQKYKDPIKSELTAIDVKQMTLEIEKGNTVSLETFGNHDICLLKTPKKLWEGYEVTHLALKNPTETIRTLVEKQSYLYGFEFVLISKEAYQAVMHYKIPDEAKESGIYQLIITATEIMAPQHVMQIRLIDTLLSKTFTSIRKNTMEALSEHELVSLGIDFGKYFLGYRKRALVKFGRK